MATFEDRLEALEAALSPARALGSMTLEDRIVALEAACTNLVSSPDPRTLETRVADLETALRVGV